MPRPIQKCPKCRELRKMTLHHIFPRQWYGKKNNHLTIYLCRRCHDTIHTLLPKHKLTPDQYIRILIKFLEDTS